MQKPIYTITSYHHYHDNAHNDEILSFITWQPENKEKVFEMKIIHVQSVLPEEDIITLKIKTGESSTKEAISKAVYHYLDFQAEE